MRNLVFALIALTSLLAPLEAENRPENESRAPLTPGQYILVDNNLNKTVISITKASDGKLALTCSSAPASPSAVFEQGPVFQFLLLYPNPDRTTALRSVTYVGVGIIGDGGKVDYTGSSAYLAAAQNKGVTSSTGKFILYKVVENP